MEDISLKLFTGLSKFKTEALDIFGYEANLDDFSNFISPYVDYMIQTSSDFEFNQVASRLNDVTEFEFKHDKSNIYFIGETETMTGAKKILLPYPIDMGIEGAICTTSNTLSLFNPKVLFMVGIAAGNRNVSHVGDILVAEKSFNYHSVDLITKGDVIKKKLRQGPFGVSKHFLSKVKTILNDEVVSGIEQRYNSKKPSSALKTIVGTIATGSVLVRSNNYITDLSKEYTKLVGLDMETSGFYYTCTNVNKLIQPSFISIKSVSDFGDTITAKMTTAERRNYAIHTSIEAALEVINKL